MKRMFVAGVIGLAALGLWLAPQNTSDRDNSPRTVVAASMTGAAQTEPGAIGTSGVAHVGAAENQAGDVVTEIETITGANDGMALVGRRVDLHVEVQDLSNERAFWVGSPDNRVLVVMRRDTRSGVDRQRGMPSGHRIAPVRDGQRAAISGVIRPMPKAEERFSWNLTPGELQVLDERKIYILADSVSSEGHGTD
jgi:hypothetical protein